MLVGDGYFYSEQYDTGGKVLVRKLCRATVGTLYM